MTEDEIRELILSQSPNRKLSCKQAFEIAEKAGVSKKRLGEILNEIEVKVCSCQLGCFS
ncbi:MAG: hypothetical protein ACP5VS_11625 [Desulfomonilaceae bacterium]